MQNHWLVSYNNIYFICKYWKADEKKSKDDKQTLEKIFQFSSLLFTSKMSVITNSYMKWVKLFLFLPYNKHLFNRARSVCMGEIILIEVVCTDWTQWGLYTRHKPGGQNYPTAGHFVCPFHSPLNNETPGFERQCFISFSIWSFVLTLSQCHLSYSLHLVFPSFF